MLIGQSFLYPSTHVAKYQYSTDLIFNRKTTIQPVGKWVFLHQYWKHEKVFALKTSLQSAKEAKMRKVKDPSSKEFIILFCAICK